MGVIAKSGARVISIVTQISLGAVAARNIYWQKGLNIKLLWALKQIQLFFFRYNELLRAVTQHQRAFRKKKKKALCLRPRLHDTSVHIKRNASVTVWTFLYMTTMCSCTRDCKRLTMGWRIRFFWIMQPSFRHSGADVTTFSGTLLFESNSRMRRQQTTMVDCRPVFMPMTLTQNVAALNDKCDQRSRVVIALHSALCSTHSACLCSCLPLCYVITLPTPSLVCVVLRCSCKHKDVAPVFSRLQLGLSVCEPTTARSWMGNSVRIDSVLTNQRSLGIFLQCNRSFISIAEQSPFFKMLSSGNKQNNNAASFKCKRTTKIGLVASCVYSGIYCQQDRTSRWIKEDVLKKEHI